MTRSIGSRLSEPQRAELRYACIASRKPQCNSFVIADCFLPDKIVESIRLVKLKAISTMLSMILSVVRGVSLRDLEKIKAIASQAYPTVSQLNTDTLAHWMETSAPLLLVDVRSPEEFAVSHLRGAINLQAAEQIAEAVRKHKAEKTILYCSVGFRSSRVAHVLTERGVPGIVNLEGSIFQWANEGRTVYQGNKVVQQVHPYGKRWTGLLNQGLASEC